MAPLSFYPIFGKKVIWFHQQALCTTAIKRINRVKPVRRPFLAEKKKNTPMSYIVLVDSKDAHSKTSFQCFSQHDLTIKRGVLVFFDYENSWVTVSR